MIKKINAIDNSGFVKKTTAKNKKETKKKTTKKTDYNTKIIDMEDKIPNLATTTSLNAIINEVKGEIPSINDLPITTALNDFKNNIPDVGTLIKKLLKQNDTKVVEIEKKLDHDHSNHYITNQEFIS